MRRRRGVRREVEVLSGQVGQAWSRKELHVVKIVGCQRQVAQCGVDVAVDWMRAPGKHRGGLAGRVLQ